MTASRDENAVRALIAMLRPAVDEVVLGVDSRAAEAILGACGDMVDRPFVYDFDGSVERYTAWLYERCTCDWVLRFDDDEVPGTALLDRLPELAALRRPVAVMLPVRNLHPTTDRFIWSHPWYPEYRPRMVRNLPGVWLVEGGCHSVVDVIGERHRVPDAPVYHLHHADRDLDSRLALARQRELLDPGLRTEFYPVNALAVPELWANVETRPVPPEDRPAIAAVVSPVATTPGPVPQAERISPVEAERLLAVRKVLDGAYAAEIEISPARRHVAAATTAYIEVRSRNLGTERWPAAHQGSPLIRLAYRWLTADGLTVVEPEGLRTPFEETVLPGEQTTTMMAVVTPAQPGRYLLEIDVVHELVRWFDCATRMEVAVESLDAPPSSGGLPRPNLRDIALPAPGAVGLPSQRGRRRVGRLASAVTSLRRPRAPRRSGEPCG